MSKQPEGRLSKTIIDAMIRKGAYVWKVHGNEYTPAGTPDIVGSYRGHFVAVESKMPGEKCSTIQEYRIGRIRMSGGLVVAPCYTKQAALEMLGAIDDSLEPDNSDHDHRLAVAKLRRVWGIEAGF